MKYFRLQGKSTLVAQVFGLRYAELAGTCAQMKLALPGTINVQLYRQGSVRSWHDIVATEWGNIFLFSERAVEGVRRNHLSGIEFENIEITRQEVGALEMLPMPRYFWGRITGIIKYKPMLNGVPLAITPNGMAFVEAPERGRVIEGRLILDPNETFDFAYLVPARVVNVFISLRVGKVAKQERWTGIALPYEPREELHVQL